MNVITCPNRKCHQVLAESDAKFTQVNATQFDMECLKCGHKWRAHHADFRQAPDPLRNPFKPINITPQT